MSNSILEVISKDDITNNIIIDSNGCWNFKILHKNKSTHIYGRLQRRVNGKKVWIPAHRAAYYLYNWVLPEGLFVCHKCDNPPCCNPDHLFLGTPMDNTRDMISKGRRVTYIHYGNKFRAKPIRIGELVFESYREAGVHFWISDNGVKKRFKGAIEVLCGDSLWSKTLDFKSG